MNNAEMIAALRYCLSHGCGRCVALDANGRCTAHGVVGLMSQAADLIEAQAKRIEELEAQLPKEGEWQWLSSTYDRVPCEMIYWCSVCHHEEVVHYERPWKHYCPSCGARMKGEQE